MKKTVKEKFVCATVYVFLFLIIYMVGSKILCGKVCFFCGNNNKNILETDDLKNVSKDFQIQEDGSFLSVSSDSWFDILENFDVKTIVIDIDTISEIHDSQIFYYSDDLMLDESRSCYFKLKKGMNYIQIPDGRYNMFRLDLTDDADVNLKINNIALYGSRVLSARIFLLLVVVWLFCSWLFCQVLHIYKYFIKIDSGKNVGMRQGIYVIYQGIQGILLKRQEKIVSFFQFFVLYLIEFSIMMNRHYSVDSFSYSSRSATFYQAQLLTGRVGAYVASFLFKDIDISKHQFWFMCVLILTIAFSAATIYNHYTQWISGDKRKRFLLKLAVALIYGNVYMTDFFHFPEAIPPMACGIIFMTFAVWQVVPDMSIKNYLFMTFFMIVSLNCYQVMLGFFTFFALVSIYFIKKGILTKEAYTCSFFVVLFGGGVAAATNVVLLRVLQNIGVVGITNRTEVVGIEGWISNARQIAQGACALFKDTRKFLPLPHSLFLILLLLYTLVILSLWNMRASWHIYLYIFLMVLVCRGMVFAPHMLASEVWLAPRSIISYWSIVSIPCIVLVVLSNKDMIQNIALVFMGCFCLINAIGIQRIGVNMIARNRIDEEISYMIQSKIKEYENESGMEINTIFYRNDIAPCWYYHSADFGAFELAQRGYTVSWNCGVQMINYFNGENYSDTWMDDETFKKYFDKENWDCLNLDEQLVFDGDTAYFVAY